MKCMMGSSTSRCLFLRGSPPPSALCWWVFCRKTSTDASGPSPTLWVRLSTVTLHKWAFYTIRTFLLDLFWEQLCTQSPRLKQHGNKVDTKSPLEGQFVWKMPVCTGHMNKVSIILFTVGNKEPRLLLFNQLGRPWPQENHSPLQPQCGELFHVVCLCKHVHSFHTRGHPSRFTSCIQCFFFQRGPADTQHIDPEFTREMVPNSVSRSPELNGSSSSNNAFNGFSFVGTEDGFLWGGSSPLNSLDTLVDSVERVQLFWVPWI